MLLALGLVAIIWKNDEHSQKPISNYVPPKGTDIVRGSGPLGCDFSAIDGPILTGVMPRIGKPSVALQVPKAYLPGPFYPRDGRLGANGSLLMYMQIDRFTPYPTNQMVGKIARGEDDWIMLLLYQIRSLEEIAPWNARFNARAQPGTKFNEIVQENGLLKYDYSPPLMSKETYIAREAGKITDLITCSINNYPGSRTYPNCDHITSAGDVDIKITYAARELNNWRAIRDRTRKFVACLITP